MSKFIPKFQVYIITNDVNDKVYIGQTTNTLKERFNQHYNSPESHVGVAMHEIGKEHFSISVLDDTANNLDELLEKERYYIQKYNAIDNGYNSTLQRTSGKISSRKRFSTTLTQSNKKAIEDYSRKTLIPISKLMDIAVMNLIENGIKDSHN